MIVFYYWFLFGGITEMHDCLTVRLFVVEFGNSAVKKPGYGTMVTGRDKNTVYIQANEQSKVIQAFYLKVFLRLFRSLPHDNVLRCLHILSVNCR